MTLREGIYLGLFVGWIVSVGTARALGYSAGVKDTKAAHATEALRQTGIEDVTAADINAAIDDYAAADVTRTQIITADDVNGAVALAEQQGRLEGKADGYRKGFEAAAALPNSCFNDRGATPRELQDAAASQWRAIFGAPGDDQELARPKGLPRP